MKHSQTYLIDNSEKLKMVFKVVSTPLFSTTGDFFLTFNC